MAAAEKEEKKPVMSCASSGHTTNLKQSIMELLISMANAYYKYNGATFCTKVITKPNHSHGIAIYLV